MLHSLVSANPLFNWARWISRALAGLGLTTAGWAAEVVPPAGTPPKDEFSRLVKLEPFVVRGKQLSISIHSRSGRDRSYALGFAEEVISIAHEAGVFSDSGKGLVIIGKKGEPHPVHVFRKFLALADAGKLDPAVAARRAELVTMLDDWQHNANGTKVSAEDGDTKVDLEFEKIIAALPLPLADIGAQLYQLAWFEQFDEAKVEAKLRALRATDLERNLFTRYDWVFYLPPKGAFDAALDELIAAELKEDGAGLMERMAVKGVMMVVKPKIRRAIEALRQGLLFYTVTKASTPLGEEGASALTEAFVNAHFGEDEKDGLSAHDRAVNAVRKKFAGLKLKPAEKDNE